MIGEAYKQIEIKSVNLMPLQAQIVIEMMEHGAFDVNNGSVTLHFSDGIVRKIIKNEVIFKK